MNRRRRLANAVGVVGLLATTATTAVAVPSQAAPSGHRGAAHHVVPGSGLQSFTLSGHASAVEFVEDRSEALSHPEAEGHVPNADTSLQAGPIGYSLGSIVWPGGTAGNLGTLLQVLGAPSTLPNINYPVRAEARNGDGKVVNTSYPDIVMKADAGKTSTAALATLKRASAKGVFSVGESTASARTRLVGKYGGVATGRARLADVVLGGGAIKIGAVTSRARARTNGKKTTSWSKTTVAGVTIAGIPVKVTHSGIKIGSTKGGLLAGAASKLVNSTLKQLGITLALVKPSRKRKHGHVTYTSGALRFELSQPSQGDEDVQLNLGVVALAAQATRAHPYTSPPVKRSPPATSGGGDNTGGGGSFAGGTGSSGGLPGVQTGLGGGGGGGGPAVAPPAEPVSAALPPLSGTLSTWWLIGGLVLAVGIGLGLLRRLPTVFAGSSAGCPREERSL